MKYMVDRQTTIIISSDTDAIDSVTASFDMLYKNFTESTALRSGVLKGSSKRVSIFPANTTGARISLQQ